MKKVLVIFLIFTVTSLTNATVTWTITDDGAGNITVSVVDNPEEPVGLALAIDSNGILSSFAAGLDAPEHTYFYDTLENCGLGYLGQGEVWMMGDYPGVEYNDGDWLTAAFDLACGKTSATISLYSWTGGEPVFLTSHVVPEPITLSLLAFGGLFIRRRR
jgi:hypothetical protein